LETTHNRIHDEGVRLRGWHGERQLQMGGRRGRAPAPPAGAKCPEGLLCKEVTGSAGICHTPGWCKANETAAVELCCPEPSPDHRLVSCVQLKCTWASTGPTENVRDLAQYQSKDVFIARVTVSRQRHDDDLDCSSWLTPAPRGSAIHSSSTTATGPAGMPTLCWASWPTSARSRVVASRTRRRISRRWIQNKGYTVKTIGAPDAYSYWSTIGKVVYAAGSTRAVYAAAFMAAKHNAPLIVKALLWTALPTCPAGRSCS